MASSRIEALLQRVLEKVDGLERQVASQNSRFEDVQSELRAVDAKVEAVDAKMEAVDAKVEAANVKVEAVRAEVVAAKERQDATDASLKDVVKFAGEERARRIKQEWQQIKFVSVIHVVASVGFVKEVLVCFSLNRSTWIDVRLWRVVINNVYKHKEQRFSHTRADGTRMYGDVEFEETRLLRQCRRGRESSVQRLLRMGANVHITNEEGDPALSVASGLGRTRLVSALIAAGADVNFGRAKGPYVGRTALMLAADGNHPEAMTVLVQAGADMNQEDDGGRTVLMWADKEAAKTLLTLGADVNYASSKDGMTALMNTANNPEMVKFFIDAGADVHLADNEGKTALFHVDDDEESVKLLLAAGADANHANNEGKTAIFRAAFWGRLGSLKVLVDAGANAQHADNEGYTALFGPALWYEEHGEIDDGCEIDFDDVEAVKLLIAAGVDANHIANDGNTALSRYTAALQRTTENLQNADEEEDDIEVLEKRVAIFTVIVALINERIAQLAELAKQAAAETAAAHATAAATSKASAAKVKDEGKDEGKAKGGEESGKRKR